MNIYTNIFLEFLLISTSILILFRLRKKIGLAPLYILLGTVQYVQALSKTMIHVEVFDRFTIYPGSVILFSAVLFAVLLIYIKEGVISARMLILGIIISNFILSAIFGMTYKQELIIGNNQDQNAVSAFLINYKYFLTGTLILLIDFILLGIIYQFLISKIKKLNFFIVLFISLFTVLFFDSLAFNIILKYNSSELLNSIVGHTIGKTVSAFIFSVILYIYLRYIDVDKEISTFIANQNRDVLSILTYKKKLQDLQIEKKQVEEKLTSQLETTLNNISDGFVSLDTNWCFSFLNNKAGELLGRKPEDLIGKHVWTEFPEVVGLPFYKAYQEAFKTRQTIVIEEYYEPFKKWFENRIYPTSDGLIIYFTDITEQKQAEAALIKSENYLNNIINNIGDPIFVKDDQSKLLLVNDAFCKIFNLSRKDIIGKTLAENVSEDERESFLRIDKEVLETGIENVNEETLTIEGSDRRIISTKKTRFIDETNTTFLIGIIRDITDRKKVEDELEKHKNNLEELVKLRTEEVSLKNEELQRMNKLFVGRELKMKELKNIIKELEQKKDTK